MPSSPRKIRFDDSVKVSQRASKDIVNWLRDLKQTITVKNVEADRDFQKIDVDLIWTTAKGEYKVEIKGDQWHKTGNFFLETESNREKKTPGCFLYTEADLVFYYFLEVRLLFILPMPVTQSWFRHNLGRFEEKATTTPTADGNSYTTIGRIVPINTLLEEVREVRRVELPTAPS